MRPFVMTIAGHDPSGGAGLIADCKTFEQHKTVGLSVCTANTVQTESKFLSVNWLPHDLIMQQVEILYKEYQPQVVKVGLIESFGLLISVLKWLKQQNPDLTIIWDPVLKSTTGFEFHNKTEGLNSMLKYVSMVTPNIQEAMQLFGSKNSEDIKITCHENPTLLVLLKGGHAGQKGTDLFISENEIFKISGQPFTEHEKHGTGCILSSAIAANIAKGSELKEACIKGKKYVEKVMLSNKGLLAYHKV